MTRTISLVRCPHCEQFMDEDGNWSVCNPCGYNYVYSDSKGPHHKFEATLGDWACAVNVYPDLNKTVLTAYHSSYGIDSDDVSHDHGHTHIELPHAMNDLTPDKVIDKIKLILMFA
jgi:hypothetical protein